MKLSQHIILIMLFLWSSDTYGQDYETVYDSYWSAN